MHLAEIQGLSRALKAYGAQVELLADGSLVATLVDARGTATDQAAQAARCALLIKARWPEAAIALCTGRGRLRERLPIGEVLDRAMLLLDRAGAQPSEIPLDDVTQGLLIEDACVAAQRLGTYLLFPMAFLYRHHVELRIKKHLNDPALDLNSLDMANYFTTMRQIAELFDVLSDCMHEVVRQRSA